MNNHLKNKLVEGFWLECRDEFMSLSQGLRTSLRLDDSLGLIRLRKAIILTDVVYYRAKIQIEISKGKKHTSQVQNSGTSSQVYPFRENAQGHA